MPAFLPFSPTSAFASSISCRTSELIWSDRRRISSAVGASWVDDPVVVASDIRGLLRGSVERDGRRGSGTAADGAAEPRGAPAGAAPGLGAGAGPGDGCARLAEREARTAQAG